MEYLTRRTMEYLAEQVKAGRIRPRVEVEELLAFISSAYTGIQTICIVNNCYKHEGNPLAKYYQPDMQFRTLAKKREFFDQREMKKIDWALSWSR